MSVDPAPSSFHVLGELAVRVGGRPVTLGPLRQRLVLALLLCRANHWVSVNTLVEVLWPDEPPRTARKNLQGHVCAVRRMLGDAGGGDRLEHGGGGYRITVAEQELDLLRFAALARAGRRAADDGAAALAGDLLGRALQEWTGPPLTDLRSSAELDGDVRRIVEDGLGALEDWAELAVQQGRARDVVERARAIVARHPLRERLLAVQMTALAHTGRRSEALAVYAELRQSLGRELGLAPGPATEAAHRSILAAAGPAGARPTAAPCVLPPDVPDLIGRAALVGAVTEGVTRAGAVVVLTGPAGVGATALAAHVAHRLAGDFPDGRLTVRLRDDVGASRPLEHVLAELTAGAGAPPSPLGPGRALSAWQAWLAPRRVLLLLDDAADEAQVRPLLPAVGRSATIVVGRSALAALAVDRRIEVPPLTSAEAVELIGRIIGLARLRSDQPAAERIVDACGMLPLAVRVAGLKLVALRHLPLSEFAARLADEPAALDALSVGDLAVRSRLHREWHRHGEPVRRALASLAAIPQPFTLDEAAGALGCAPGPALHLIERMIESGAVAPPACEVLAHSALYAVPRLVRLYARSLTI